MENYKIKVNNEAESREAQELFFELGAVWGQSKTATLNLEPMSFIYFNGSSIYYGHDDENDDYWFQVEESGKEITLPQLRDLVVLHRNDVSDANYSLFISTSQPTLEIYKTSNDKFYVYAHGHHAWTESFSVGINTPNLKEIEHSKAEQGLISGKEALIALANGEDVECRAYEHNWINVDNKHHPLSLFFDDSFQFRLKPRAITINRIEVPAPFKPKEGERVWFICDDNDFGYAKSESYGDDIKSFYGWWRTEEEIKQVAAALRGALKNG